MNVPSPAPLVDGGPEMPWCIVGDETFGMSLFMIRPYPRCRGLNRKQSVFNYRSSRAQRIAECGFGISTQVWRVCRSQMDTSLQVSIQVRIHACTCLHNFLIMNEERRFRKRRSPEDRIQQHNHRYGPEEEVELRVGTLDRIRYNFSMPFVGPSVIDCQWEKARRGDF